MGIASKRVQKNWQSPCHSRHGNSEWCSPQQASGSTIQQCLAVFRVRICGVHDEYGGEEQQMQWTPRGVHLLLQAHTKALNEKLEQTFQYLYSGFRKTDYQFTKAALLTQDFYALPITDLRGYFAFPLSVEFDAACPRSW